MQRPSRRNVSKFKFFGGKPEPPWPLGGYGTDLCRMLWVYQGLLGISGIKITIINKISVRNTEEDWTR